MKTTAVYVIAFCCMTACGAASHAEVIRIPVGQQASDKRDIARPTRGMDKTRVIAEYGEPQSKMAAVGEPPISRWVYPDFTVYFESDTVIHSVLTHRPSAAGAHATTE
jgi:hypothetical protein